MTRRLWRRGFSPAGRVGAMYSGLQNVTRLEVTVIWASVESLRDRLEAVLGASWLVILVLQDVVEWRVRCSFRWSRD